MYNKIFRAFSAILLISILGVSFAATQTEKTGTATPPNLISLWQHYLVPSQPELNAKEYVLLDVNSGQVIAAKNEHHRVPPASLTKLMTLYIVFSELSSGNIHLDDKVRISKKAWSTGGSRMFVKLGSEVPVKDLIQGVTVQSGNDATMALAEYVGGTIGAFVQMMNQQAKVLGMKDSHFSDPTGLPEPAHLTTAYDLSLLARQIILQFPQYYHFFGEKWFTWNKIRQPNRNRLLWRNIGVDGLKTGHTSSAGFCLIASALQNDTRFLSVVMGTPNDNARQDDSQALLNYAFRFFQSAKIYNANQSIFQQRVWKGKQSKLSLGVSHDFFVTIPKRAYSDLKVTLQLDPKVTAPIKKGQQLGQVQVFLKDQQIASTPLVALNDDPKGGLWTRFMDSIAYFFHKIFGKKAATQIVIGNQS